MRSIFVFAFLLPLFGAEKEKLGEHFSTEYIVGALAHSDHGPPSSSFQLSRAMRVGICPPILGTLGGVCFDPVEVFRPVGRLLSGKGAKPTKSFWPRMASGGTQATHVHNGVVYPGAPHRALPDFSEIDTSRPLSENKGEEAKISVTVTCPGGLKIEIAGASSAAQAVVKTAAESCTAK